MVTGCMTAEEVYRDYFEKVSAYVRGKIPDHHEAEDVTSSVFLKICQKLDSYDPRKASISTWVYTITHNAVVDHYRSHKAHVAFEEYMEGELDELPEENDDDAELLEQLADVLMLLKDRERELIVLHYYKGYTLKYIAEQMQMSYVNAKIIHAKALNKMRSAMTI